VIGALAAGAALIGLFVAWEQRARAPMLPLALFRRARFTAANGVSFFMNASVFGALFLMTVTASIGGMEQTGAIAATIAVGDVPQVAAVNSCTGTVYIANSDSNMA
jgi:hypothetical protein